MSICVGLILLLVSGTAGGREIPFQRPTPEERAALGEKVRVPGAAPGVLFEKRGARVAVIATLGEKPTGGYEIEILQVTLRGSHLTVKARVAVPPKGAIVTQALTYPFDVVRISAARLTRARQPLRVELTDEKGQVLAQGGIGKER